MPEDCSLAYFINPKGRIPLSSWLRILSFLLKSPLDIFCETLVIYCKGLVMVKEIIKLIMEAIAKAIAVAKIIILWRLLIFSFTSVRGRESRAMPRVWLFLTIGIAVYKISILIFSKHCSPLRVALILYSSFSKLNWRSSTISFLYS